MEQQRDQAAVAASNDVAALSAGRSAASNPSGAASGVQLGVSSRPETPAPALPQSEAGSAAPEEQATLIGTLAPHVEPRAVRRTEAGAIATPGGLPRATAQPPQPPQSPQSPQPPQAAPVPTNGADASAAAAAPMPMPAPPPVVERAPPPPPPPPQPWGAPAGRQPLPGHAPPAPQRPPAHVPWQAAESWGVTTITIEANTAAGASYLLWWLSGLLIYFNERHNRFVRFHAMQSILLTGALTVFSVLAWIVSALCGDVAQYARDPLIRHLFGTLGWGILVLAAVIVLFVWVPAMVAAWAGNYLRLPIVGRYAERYSAPPVEPTQPPLY